MLNAFAQWKDRPADERFWTLDELLETTRRFHYDAVEAEVEVSDLRVGEQADDLVLASVESDTVAGFTHYSFGQLCQTAAAPARYIRTLPNELAARNVNHGLEQAAAAERTPRHLLLRQNGGLRAHAILSPHYGRLWNDNIVERLVDFQDQGWRIPPARPAGSDPRARPATDADVLDAMSGGTLSVKVGDMIAPAGIYASDRDMFCFMISEKAVEVEGIPPLFRGFFVSNSEVGDRSFRVTCFLFNHVCGNHIVWGAQDVVEVRVMHTGDEQTVARKAFGKMRGQLEAYMHRGTDADVLDIVRARDTKIGDSREDTVQAVAAKTKLPAGKVEAAYQIAEDHPEDGHNGADTVWGMVQGVTRLSQQSGYANERDRLDRVAGKLPRIKF